MATEIGNNRKQIKICTYCKTRFEGRKNKIFCSERCKWFAFRDKTNNPSGPEFWLRCVYCGMPADTRDHVPPQSLRPRLTELEIEFNPMIVDCCHECNSILGARYIFTISERKEYIKKCLRRRYAKYLRIPNHSESDMAEYGKNILLSVKYGLAIKQVTMERLNW